ncbi:family 2 glycosyl transferase [Salinivibrio kushneri]|uniref:Family 2 glycosyl transferase n=2 Tax=Salinivibrio kushneri TaxID=1908198 RepID=A0AB36JWF4_9GAMM|nr:family 2 glycosyl transferase [Salinivibrio kushneri]QCP02447.1 glycosyltransferase [Salinivibrio kushneri]
MATYNGAEYIEEQLQSFLDQTMQPDELIITDDCSTDQTEFIVSDFAKKAPFSVEFHRNKKNLGYCGNFNAALAKTTGDLVFLSDQDDVWFPNKIAYIFEIAKRNPHALALMNDAKLTDGKLNEVGLTKIGQIRSAGFSMNRFVMGSCCAVRRDLLELCMPIPSGFKGHDNWLIQFADGLNAKVIDTTPLQYYRRHETNESQFIANRTTKVTRNQVRIETWKRLFRQDTIVARSQQLEQLEIFIAGLSRAIELAPDEHKTSLTKLKSNYSNNVKVSAARLAIAKKSFFARLVAIIKLLVDGGYKNANGIKSACRDIVG